jgi:hypothetical protein
VNIPLGTQALADEVKQRVQSDGGTFTDQLDRLLKQSDKLERLREEVKRHTPLANQRRLYILGGVVWAIATIQQPWERGAYARLEPGDIDTFIRRLEKTPKGALPCPEYVPTMEPATRQAVEKDMLRIRKDFTPEQLLAAARLLQLLRTELGVRSEKEMLFPRNGYLGLAIGYVLHSRGKPR